MIGCLALVLVVDRREADVVVLEVGERTVDVVGLAGADEGDRFVLCHAPPAAAVPESTPPEERPGVPAA